MGAGPDVAGYDRPRFDERTATDPNTLEDRRARADPDVVLDQDRGAHDRRSLEPSTERAERPRVEDPLGRGARMEVRIGDRRVPADDHVAADRDFELREQHDEGEVAEVADPDPAVGPYGELDTFKRGVRPDPHRVRTAA